METVQRNSEDAAWIQQQARALGFDACGIAKADSFPELDRFPEWLRRGYAGEMRYLEDPHRADIRQVMPQVRSVIVCLLNYNTKRALSTERMAEQSSSEVPRGWISRYAWGDDYHQVLWDLLNRLVAQLRQKYGANFSARAFADTGPVHERVLAKHAGLGWTGKNTLLLNRKYGSWFFLGAILTSLELPSSLGPEGIPPPDLCGSCRKCLDACPIEALVEPYVMDARRCISYLTIELRGPIPREHREAMGTHVFGCDICQDVCPWNRKAPVTTRSEFLPRKLDNSDADALFEPSLEWLAGMNQEEYRSAFRRSAVKRSKWRGLVRNACIALGNVKMNRNTAKGRRIVALLGKHARGEDPVIAESAQWALSRIQQRAQKARGTRKGSSPRLVERGNEADV
jgi:epoxyqueuosine reductase